jgi:hypothetical protein
MLGNAVAAEVAQRRRSHRRWMCLAPVDKGILLVEVEVTVGSIQSTRRRMTTTTSCWPRRASIRSTWRSTSYECTASTPTRSTRSGSRRTRSDRTPSIWHDRTFAQQPLFGSAPARLGQPHLTTLATEHPSGSCQAVPKTAQRRILSMALSMRRVGAEPKGSTYRATAETRP